MNKIRITFTCFATLTVILFIYFLITHKSCHQDIKNTPEGREYLALMKDIMKKMDVQITFYGKIIDQHGQPVPNADITIEIPHFSSRGEYFEDDKTLHVKSNNKGLFTLYNQRGNRLYVESITKNGYEYILIENPNHSFEYWRDMNDRFFIPDKTNPVIFRMRKKEETQYLIHGMYFESMFTGKTNDEAWHLDLVRPAFRPAHLTNMNVDYGEKPIFTDLTVMVQSNRTQDGYLINFTVPDKIGGILQSNAMLYIAPESGYQKNLVVSMPWIPKETSETDTFFYVQSRNGKVFGRLEFHCHSYDDNENSVLIRFDNTWANPYGDRNLEEETRLKYETTERLHDEAEAALLQGKLPPKPNIQQLLKTEGE